ncbi:MAG: glycoside hydrolase family 3 C-terminal domain-containing protein [Oscillospiraceae bacterium]|nr:glycoside hydrolase family 3 C-terminal domain-containing protein [Oscillospiraceae bacterium]
MNKARLAKVRDVVGRLSLSEKARLCSGADFWNTEAVKRLGIPSISMSDGPHGLRKEKKREGGNSADSYPSTCFPTASLLACSFDRDLLHEIGEAIAREALSRGVSIVLGPGVNIKRSPLCGRNFEYYSEDPCLAGELGAAWVEGVQSAGVGACVKHYAANNQETRRFVSNSCVDARALQEIYLEVFRRVVEQAKPYAVMTSYNMLNNEYVGESEYLIKHKLREEWGFSGITISDWGAVNDRVTALGAGLDLEMPGKTSDTTTEIIAAIRGRRLTREQLDESVARILLVVEQCERSRMASSAVDYEAHDKLARRAAAESMVLLKNEAGLLPFDDGKPFALIGHFAKESRYQGTGSSRINPAKLTSMVDELESRGVPFIFSEGFNADGSTNDILVGKARRAAEEAGRAVIVAALPDVYEGEGFDRENMRLPDGILKLIDSLASACDNIAVALMLGAPVELPFEARVKSLLTCYLGGQAVGPALSEIVTGRVSPGGKLPETWPRTLLDTPCNAYYNKGKKHAEYREGVFVGYRYYDAAEVEPMFAFGHGLSYTAFEYSRLKAERTEISERGRISFSMLIKNTGPCAGAEVIQVYVARKGSFFKQLKAFKKVHLFDGESRMVDFTLAARDFCYFNTNTDRFEMESGLYTVMAGSGSRDIRLSFDVKAESRRNRVVPEYIEPKQAKDLPDKQFYELLGFIPKEPDWRPLTLNSTLFEFSHTVEGRLIVRHLKNSYFASLPKNTDEATMKMFERSLDDLPMRALSAMSGGMLTKNTAIALVHFANHRLLRGVFRLLVKRK